MTNARSFLCFRIYNTRVRDTSLFIVQYQVVCILVCAGGSLKDDLIYINRWIGRSIDRQIEIDGWMDGWIYG